jgi:hypothetical protein
MSDIPPAPPKSPIVIIGLLALAGAAIALIRLHLGLLVATTHRQAAAAGGVKTIGENEVRGWLPETAAGRSLEIRRL